MEGSLPPQENSRLLSSATRLTSVDACRVILREKDWPVELYETRPSVDTKIVLLSPVFQVLV